MNREEYINEYIECNEWTGTEEELEELKEELNEQYNEEYLYELLDFWAFDEHEWKFDDEEFEELKKVYFNNTNKRYVIYKDTPDWEVIFDLKNKVAIDISFDCGTVTLFDYFDFLEQGYEDRDFYDIDFVEGDDFELMSEKVWHGEEVKGYFAGSYINSFLEHLNKNREDY